MWISRLKKRGREGENPLEFEKTELKLPHANADTPALCRHTQAKLAGCDEKTRGVSRMEGLRHETICSFKMVQKSECARWSTMDQTENLFLHLFFLYTGVKGPLLIVLDSVIIF